MDGFDVLFDRKLLSTKLLWTNAQEIEWMEASFGLAGEEETKFSSFEVPQTRLSISIRPRSPFLSGGGNKN